MGIVPEAKLSFSDLCSPGGFLAFEHRWSLNEAFDFHMKIGKARIEERTHQLSSMLKIGLKEMKKNQVAHAHGPRPFVWDQLF
jgi:selenocysteine lyase/cysteine desulfurase